MADADRHHARESAGRMKLVWMPSVAWGWAALDLSVVISLRVVWLQENNNGRLWAARGDDPGLVELADSPQRLLIVSSLYLRSRLCTGRLAQPGSTPLATTSVVHCFSRPRVDSERY